MGKAAAWLGRLVLVPLALVLVYLLAALIGAVVPANHHWRPPTNGVLLFVRSNGVHTSLVVPAHAAGVDWRGRISHIHPHRPIGSDDHIAFAWGQREFYLHTPEWSDLRAGVAVRALLGLGGSLMHVEHIRAPDPHQWQRPLLLTPTQYRRLSHFIDASFAYPAGETPIIKGYGPADGFVPARGRYHMFHTSNGWTGAALRHAGVRMGIWTPFAQSIMWRFDAITTKPATPAMPPRPGKVPHPASPPIAASG